ncbi:MAG: ribosome assembly cofactor RimP [Flavobacteriales bacterium MED-G15]|nr:MAG: ribosome assembly cofactor RimP [Flavobacteriales bacterium MED-G15]
MNFSEKVASLLSVALENFPGIFLVDFKVSADNSIKIILDGDKDVNVKDCINISREIEGSLDREVEDFSLEVASAGVGSALKFPRQYYKNIGRKLEVVLTDGALVSGELTKVEDQQIELQWKQREPKAVGKGKITVTKNKTIAFDEINQSKVMIKF